MTELSSKFIGCCDVGSVYIQFIFVLFICCFFKIEDKRQKAGIRTIKEKQKMNEFTHMKHK